MDIKSIERFIESLWRKPLKTLLLLAILVGVIACTAWVKSCASESGKGFWQDDNTDQASNVAGGTLDNASANMVTEAAPMGVVIDSMTMGTGPGRNRIEVSVRNPYSASVVVRKIDISWLVESSRCSIEDGGHLPPDEVITISDRMNLSAQGTTLRGSFHVGDSREYRYPAQGRYTDATCGDTGLALSMRTNIILPERSTTKLYLVVPQHFRITGTTTLSPSRAARVRTREGLSLPPFFRLEIALDTSRGEDAVSMIERSFSER